MCDSQLPATLALENRGRGWRIRPEQTSTKRRPVPPKPELKLRVAGAPVTFTVVGIVRLIVTSAAIVSARA
jgi:hypothetical protein